jgi:hypothetical protein
MGYGTSIWDTIHRYGHLHVDMVIRDIDMEYGLIKWEITVSTTAPAPATATARPPLVRRRHRYRHQGLTLIHFSAHHKRHLWYTLGVLWNLVTKPAPVELSRGRVQVNIACGHE